LRRLRRFGDLRALGIGASGAIRPLGLCFSRARGRGVLSPDGPVLPHHRGPLPLLLMLLLLRGRHDSAGSQHDCNHCG